MGWQDLDSDRTFEVAGPGAIWVDLTAVAVGAGAMLLLLHKLDVLTLVVWLAAAL